MLLLFTFLLQKKKKKSGKKGTKDTSDSQSQNDAEGSATKGNNTNMMRTVLILLS